MNAMITLKRLMLSNLEIHSSTSDFKAYYYSLYNLRAATAGKEGKVWSLPRFWVSINSYKKQPVKKFGGRILDLAWLKFAVAALQKIHQSLL